MHLFCGFSMDKWGMCNTTVVALADCTMIKCCRKKILSSRAVDVLRFFMSRRGCRLILGSYVQSSLLLQQSPEKKSMNNYNRKHLPNDNIILKLHSKLYSKNLSKLSDIILLVNVNCSILMSKSWLECLVSRQLTWNFYLAI